MNSKNHFIAFVYALVVCAAVLLGAGSACAQVSPGEIVNPNLKSAEKEYLPQLRSLQHAIGETRFPLPFILTRYVGVDPDRQASLDPRGLEFVYFQNQMLLKTSGFYTAAFNSDELTENERAGRVWQEVVVPILRLIAREIPPDVGCDGIGFEIAYHVRALRKNSDYEGREILAVVLDREEAFALAAESGNEGRQAILNRSNIYLDGKPLGLALGRKDALSLEALGRSDFGEAEPAKVSPVSGSYARLTAAITRLAPGASPSPSRAVPAEKGATGIVSPPARAADPKIAPSPADVEKLQSQFQPQLDALLKEHGAEFHLVDYAPPSFVVDHKQLVLQLTLRNSLAFEKDSSSIYRRAAQSFDLFLAPQLKALLPKLPADLRIGALDFSVLNRLGNEKDSSEAVEFICPLRSMRSFVEDEITSQDLIDQSLVLVNGVRIKLNLERVE
jgi:hypothetical protein